MNRMHGSGPLAPRLVIHISPRNAASRSQSAIHLALAPPHARRGSRESRDLRVSAGGARRRGCVEPGSRGVVSAAVGGQARLTVGHNTGEIGERVGTVAFAATRMPM